MADKKKVGILLSGKMSFTALHTDEVLAEAQRAGYIVEYLLDSMGGGAGHVAFDGMALRKHLNGSKAYQLLRLIRRFSVRNESTEIKFREFISEDLFTHSSLAAILAAYQGIALASRTAGAGAICRFLERWLYRSSVFDKPIEDSRYDIALLSSVGNFGFEAECLFARECSRAGIKTVSVVTNYDNFLNRGSAGFIPTRAGVWSKYMADNALRAGVPSGRVEVIGAPSLDPLLKASGKSRVEFLRDLGLDPERKTILYAGGVLTGQSLEVIESFVKAGIIGSCNFIYRPYPHSKVFASPVPKLVAEYLASFRNTYISDAEALSNTIDASLGGFAVSVGIVDDDKTSQIRYSDVVVNHFSTLGLEACVLDVPVVQVAYDGAMYGVRRSLYPSINSNQTHNLVQVRAKASGVARSEVDMINMVREYLENKNKDSDFRRAYAELECGPLDGKATERMFELLNAA